MLSFLSSSSQKKILSTRAGIRQAFDTFRRSLTMRIVFGLILFLCVVLFIKSFVPPPAHDSFPKVVRIPFGASLREVAFLLEKEGAIGAPIIFKDYVILFGGESRLQAGDYYFKNPQSAFFAALEFTSGKKRLEPVRVTIPEGWGVEEIAIHLKEKLLSFNEEEFVKQALEKQGYLFPDTYYLQPSSEPREIIGIMETTFQKRVEPLMGEIEKFGKSLSDVVIMASILEEEAWKFETRQIIAGILWKRIAIGMPLQVDAAFLAVNGKTTFGLTIDDLREDHPYNTYTNKGLPPGPITNPGLESIMAAIRPTASPYLYYLTDKNSVMRYAVTHDEHVQNKALYMR